MIKISSMALVVDPTFGHDVLLLADSEKRRYLPIRVNLGEAQSIDRALNQIKTLRPLTHELLVEVIRRLGHEIESAQIEMDQNNQLCATIKLKGPDNDAATSFMASPADAIVVAVRAAMPIFVSEQVMALSLPFDTCRDEKEREEFKRFVEGLNASDFNKEERKYHGKQIN